MDGAKRPSSRKDGAERSEDDEENSSTDKYQPTGTNSYERTNGCESGANTCPDGKKQSSRNCFRFDDAMFSQNANNT